MRRVGLAAVVVAALFLHACASGPDLSGPSPNPPGPAGPDGSAPGGGEPSSPGSATRPATLPPGAVHLSQLPGWAGEDHVAALQAFQAGCGLSSEPPAQHACSAARFLLRPSEDQARRFFEDFFAAQRLPGQGVLTAYFAPEYEARETPGGAFTAPVRPAPADLRQGQPYATRAAIEARPPNDALAWMRPEDLFFLQVQGSGVLTYPDGRRLKAVFAGHNSLAFVGIANPMRDRGLLAANNTSGEAIRQWLADHRGRDADAIMQLNPRYVFFRLEPDDGVEPVGAAGLPLPAGHAVAVDRGYHQMGELLWIDANAPLLAGAFPAYQRLVMALDTGGAIQGEIRADLYLGKGDAAGREAGRVRHDLRMYRLVPIER